MNDKIKNKMIKMENSINMINYYNWLAKFIIEVNYDKIAHEFKESLSMCIDVGKINYFYSHEELKYNEKEYGGKIKKNAQLCFCRHYQYDEKENKYMLSKKRYFFLNNILQINGGNISNHDAIVNVNNGVFCRVYVECVLLEFDKKYKKEILEPFLKYNNLQKIKNISPIIFPNTLKDYLEKRRYFL